MPLYEYKCTNKDCETQETPFTFIAKIENRDNAICPKCGKKLKRLVTKATLHGVG